MKIALLLTLALSISLTAQIRLSSDPSTPASQVSGTAVADFNHDGNLDIATLLNNGRSLSIQLGQGNGLFKSGFKEPTSVGIGGVIAADFNQDGNLDLVAYGRGNPQISVFLGNGDGTFQPESVITTDFVAQTAAVASLNGDAFPDFVVVGGSIAQPFLSNGDGTFTQGKTVTPSPGNSCLSIAIADFNRDGNEDIAVTCRGLELLNGKGDGTFGPPVLISGSEDFVTAGDFNRDGNIDLAASVNGGGLDVYLNSGNGTFGGPENYPGNFGTLNTGDLNGDGVLDIYAAFEQSVGVVILFGKPNGTFEEPTLTLYTSGDYTSAVAAGDFTNDGIIDLVTENQESICVLPGLGQGQFVQPAPITITGSGGIIAAKVDLNHDGLDDLVYFTPTGNHMLMNTALNNGGGLFTTASTDLLGTFYNPGVASEVAVGDLNGDGSTDIVFGSTDGYLLTALSSGNGTFSKATVVGRLPTMGGSSGFLSTILGDFNGDGKLDVAGLYFHTNALSQDLYLGLAIFQGNGDGTFSNSDFTVLSSKYNIGSLVTGDFNGDGKTDLAAITGLDLLILLGNGDGTFARGLGGPSTANAIAAADIDQDGLTDLVTVTNTKGSTGVATLLLSHGDGTFARGNYRVGVGPGIIAIADLNADGYPDVVVSNGGSNDITVLANQQNGTLLPEGSWYAPSGSLFTGQFLGAAQPSILSGSYLLEVSK